MVASPAEVASSQGPVFVRALAAFPAWHCRQEREQVVRCAFRVVSTTADIVVRSPEKGKGASSRCWTEFRVGLKRKVGVLVWDILV